MSLRHRLFSAAIVGALAAVVCSSCSVLVDLDECQAEPGCVAKYGRGWTCTADHLCERKALLDQTDSGPCSQSEGPVTDPGSFNIGVMLPLSGDEGGDGRALLDAIKLGQTDFNQLGGVDDHKIGLVICDTQGKDDVALESADHLVNKAAVNAIIGPNFSSQTVDVATQYAIPNNVLLVSPSATAIPISNLDDHDLVWRTTPSDALQAFAMGRLVSDLIDQKKQEKGSGAVVKLVVLARRDDVYAQGLRDTLPQYLPGDIVNGDEDHYFTRNYQNPSAGQGTDYSGVVAEVSTQRTPPDIVVILGFSESWQIARQLDKALSGSDTLYVFADAGRVADEASKPESDALEGRVMGTAPRGGDPTYAPWQAFKSKYNSLPDHHAENVQYVANAYDALYAIALAAAGTGFTGPELAKGMGQLSDGDEILATQEDAQNGMQLRKQGKSINLQGASGELDWNDNGDPTVGEISLWCLKNGQEPDEGVLLDRNGEYNSQSCSADTCSSDTDCPTGFSCSASGTCNRD